MSGRCVPASGHPSLATYLLPKVDVLRLIILQAASPGNSIMDSPPAAGAGAEGSEGLAPRVAQVGDAQAGCVLCAACAVASAVSDPSTEPPPLPQPCCCRRRHSINWAASYSFFQADNHTGALEMEQGSTAGQLRRARCKKGRC